MNKLLYFILGAAVGATGAYVVTARKLNAANEKDLHEMRDWYEAKLDEVKTQLGLVTTSEASLEEGPADTDSDEEVDDTEDEEEVEEDPKTRKKYVDYTKFYNKPPIDEVFEDKIVEEKMNEEDKKVMPFEKPAKKVWDPKYPKPYDISPDEFVERNGYDKITLTYYADGVLADDSEKTVHPAMVDMENNVEHFDEFEEGVLYVRNESNSTDYEIVRNEKTFKEVTEGVDDED